MNIVITIADALFRLFLPNFWTCPHRASHNILPEINALLCVSKCSHEYVNLSNLICQSQNISNTDDKYRRFTTKLIPCIIKESAFTR